MSADLVGPLDDQQVGVGFLSQHRRGRGQASEPGTDHQGMHRRWAGKGQASSVSSSGTSNVAVQEVDLVGDDLLEVWIQKGLEVGARYLTDKDDVFIAILDAVMTDAGRGISWSPPNPSRCACSGWVLQLAQ